MSTGWDGFEPAPLEYFHGRLQDLFHEFRRKKVGQDVLRVEMNGNDFNNIVAKAKTDTYLKYPNHLNSEAVPSEETNQNMLSDYNLASDPSKKP